MTWLSSPRCVRKERPTYPAHHHRRAEVNDDLIEEMDDDTSLSPFDIAELAAAGDSEMEKLFVEFAEAMKGSKSGVVSAPLAKALGIEPGTDSASALDETTRLGTIPSPVWARLIDMNLHGTFLSHVETFGRAGWQRSRWWALEQTGFAPTILPELAKEMVVVLKASAMLPDTETKAKAQNILDARIGNWTVEHGNSLLT